MIDYVDTKERQGIFFERPVSMEKHQSIHAKTH